ncbi:MAG TPA: hypothetical protein VNT26_03815 [Candidatus Sulfotelmatobacter sp.]|nr:hypothetical protein [Candidatus Sulfotelmatobacter sp.]
MTRKIQHAFRSDTATVGTPPGRLPAGRIPFFLFVALLAALATALFEGRQAAGQRHQVQRLQQEQARLTEQIQRLQQERGDALKQLAALAATRTPGLPAPPPQPIAQPNAATSQVLPSTNLYARLKDNPPRLTAEQVEAYLNAHGRKAAHLLATYRTSGDPRLLTEAMQNFPNDPLVAFEAVFKADLSPEQRRQWLSTFAQAAPDNPLPNYLAARDYFKAGQTDQALQQLLAASGKPQFQDYTLSRRQDDEEAYLAAGYPVAEAKVLASSQLMLPQLSQFKQLGQQMVDLANSYRQAGDDASAQTVLQMATRLGQSYDGASAGDCAISHLVGLAIERNALGAMDPNSPYGASGHTVQDRLNQLTEQKVAIKTLFEQNSPMLERMSDQDWISYIDREKISGEEAALRWAVSKFGQK